MTAVLHHKAWPLFLCGQGLLAFIFICLYLLAPEFDYMRQWVDRPLLEYVGLMMLAGITYFGLVFLIPILAGVRQSIWLLVIPGIILRLIIFPAAPIQEDDFYRYLWDGAVTAEGYNPYVSTGRCITFSTAFDSPYRSPDRPLLSLTKYQYEIFAARIGGTSGARYC